MIDLVHIGTNRTFGGEANKSLSHCNDCALHFFSSPHYVLYLFSIIRCGKCMILLLFPFFILVAIDIFFNSDLNLTAQC